MTWLINLFEALLRALTLKAPAIVPPAPPIVLPEPPKPVEQAPMPTYNFDTPKQAYHSVRIICDEIGLTLDQKNILCACVYQESQFHNYVAPGVPTKNENKDLKTGQVWSTDYGICQVNDYWHIGKGKDFPTLDYVMHNPDKIVRWMASIMKHTGKLQPWSSYSTGAYTRWLSASSPMWKLGQ